MLDALIRASFAASFTVRSGSTSLSFMVRSGCYGFPARGRGAALTAPVSVLAVDLVRPAGEELRPPAVPRLSQQEVRRDRRVLLERLVRLLDRPVDQHQQPPLGGEPVAD